MWQNKFSLRYAWRILNRGVCDGCALGTSGLKDWTLPGIHLCWIRLNLLRLNTMSKLDAHLLADISQLDQMDERSLRKLGRIPYPLLRQRGETGFTRISWDEALSLAARRIQVVDRTKLAFYLVSRGTVNETYYAIQKAARAMGTNHVDNSARICHAPSTVGLKQTTGFAATTCSYTDLIGSDWVIFFGSNAANNQPVMMKYLIMAKEKGTRVAVVNPYLEPGMQKYWVPSNVKSAVLGTPIADVFFQIAPGGDIALIQGVLKEMIDQSLLDDSFIRENTCGWPELEAQLRQLEWSDIESQSGLARTEIKRFADLFGKAKSAVLVWSMGITMHRHGVDNVKALVNLALSRGMIGRPHCGLMPIRGHSGVQGGAEMGAVPNALPGGIAIDDERRSELEALWGFPIPEWKGDYVMDMVHRAHDHNLEILYCIGSNLMDVLPDRDYVTRALRRIPLRIHHDIVLNKQMFVEPMDTVLVLPATTRYEMAGGNCETTTERRVVFNPEIPGPRIEEARDEWRVIQDLCFRVTEKPLCPFQSTDDIRKEIEMAVPAYAGIGALKKAGDQFQWGGTRLGEQGFSTPDGKARFSTVSAADVRALDDRFVLSTRRGKQFNSMAFVDRDNLAGAQIDHVIISEHELSKRGWSTGMSVRVRSNHGSIKGRLATGNIRDGMAMVYWPASNALIDFRATEPHSGMPAFRETVVSIEPEPNDQTD